VFSIPLASDRRMPLNVGDLIVAIGMLLLYIEVLKAARFGGKGVTDHILSFILFVAMVSELALVPQASTPTLLLLAVLGFVDFITGISLSVRRKQRAMVVEGADQRV
jgi:hypothetical protein